MHTQKSLSRVSNYLWLAVGCTLFGFIGMRWNVPIAVWLAPVFLIRFSRSQNRWYKVLIALPLLMVAAFAKFHGGWDLSIPAEIGFSVLLAAPTLVALLMDRLLAPRLGGVAAALVYPAAYTALEFLFSLMPVGTSLSIAVTQFDALPLVQLVSITGVWGIPFVVGWFASTVNALWEKGFDGKRAAGPAAVFAATFAAILLFGGLRLAAAAPEAETVRIGGVTVEQTTDYWGKIIDQGTPEETARAYAAEFEALEDALFAESERAVQQGAKIVFWAEAESVLLEEREADFLRRSQDFARQHRVYFVPAVVVLKYGEMYRDNKLVMIDPDGEIVYSYTKTMSWYPTDSDGVLHTVDPPYGRISTAICFDMDFPGFINQAGKQGVDIMLVPAFDWEQIKAFHSQVGLLRGVENGFSVMRQTNAGMSLAIDYQGRVLARQDFFTTANRVMIADVPTQGVPTLYGALGDWFAYAAILFVVAASVWAIVRRGK